MLLQGFDSNAHDKTEKENVTPGFDSNAHDKTEKEIMPIFTMQTKK